MSRRIIKLAGAIAATASMVIFGSTNAHAATIDGTVGGLNKANYVALGDSFATGSGLGSYLDTTCYQSKYGYPVVLSTSSTSTTRDVTSYVCNGATSAGTATTNSVAKQLAKFTGTTAAAAGVTLVTLTVGGNDLGFVSAMTKCVTGSIDCDKDPNVTGPIASGLSNLPGTIAANVTAIRGTFKNARIQVTGYPQLFQNPTSAQCKVGTVLGILPLYMKASETAYLDTETGLLNAAINQGVTQSGDTNVGFVDVVPTFGAHGLCLGSTKSWIQSYSSSNTVGAFHPNQNGQKLGYATRIAEVTALP